VFQARIVGGFYAPDDVRSVWRENEVAATLAYEKALHKRQVWVEPLFGEGKQWHGMRRFRFRGLWRVNIEALLMATGQNLKRLLQQRGWGCRPFPGGATAAANAFVVLSCWLVAVCEGGAAGYFRTLLSHLPTYQAQLAA
jgi:hypothetical protein